MKDITELVCKRVVSANKTYLLRVVLTQNLFARGGFHITKLIM